jgi:hypothetical protein
MRANVGGVKTREAAEKLMRGLAGRDYGFLRPGARGTLQFILTVAPDTRHLV